MPRSHASGFRDQARTLLAAARLLADLSGDDESYGSAIGLLAIHATISAADAVAIAHGGRKSAGSAHDAAASLLTAVLGTRFPAAERKRLLAIISQKDALAYQGQFVQLRDAVDLLKSAERFAAWAGREYQRRP